MKFFALDGRGPKVADFVILICCLLRGYQLVVHLHGVKAEVVEQESVEQEVGWVVVEKVVFGQMMFGQVVVRGEVAEGFVLESHSHRCLQSLQTSDFGVCET